MKLSNICNFVYACIFEKKSLLVCCFINALLLVSKGVCCRERRHPSWCSCTHSHRRLRLFLFVENLHLPFSITSAIMTSGTSAGNASGSASGLTYQEVIDKQKKMLNRCASFRRGSVLGSNDNRALTCLMTLSVTNDGCMSFNAGITSCYLLNLPLTSRSFYTLGILHFRENDLTNDHR